MPRILISGASGLIGSALAASLRKSSCDVFELVRRPPQNSHEIEWHPESEVGSSLVSGFDTVIHLSGENLAGRWNQAKKRRIRDSRVVTTANLARALASAREKPSVFICASAIGYYGNRGDEVLEETSPPGSGFLADVCKEWELAAQPAAASGIRSVNLRTGIVLSPKGGALKQMLLPFRLGVGGRIGSGRQWWSWIHMDDYVTAIHHILRNQSISGPTDMTAPKPVTNADFTHVLARTLKRPAILPVPAAALKLIFGEFAEEGLLSSARVLPAKLSESGFEFSYPELGGALAQLLQSA